jgi:hypothetical protein
VCDLADLLAMGERPGSLQPQPLTPLLLGGRVPALAAHTAYPGHTPATSRRHDLISTSSTWSSRQACHLVRSGSWIASLGSNRFPHGREQAYNFIEVVAQRLDDGTALTIGVQFDGLALCPSWFGERAISEQASVLESPYAVIEFGF